MSEPEEVAAADTEPTTRAPRLADTVRDKLSPEGVAELRAVMNDPGLALNMVVREVVAKIGRYAQTGDKSGVKRGVMELVEKLDVSSPRDGAVLMVQQTLGGAQNPASQVFSSLEAGKQSPQSTQAGRTLSAIAPILRENGMFEWKDGMDRGWGRVNQRFAEQASGVVDVVVGTRGAEAPALAGLPTPGAPPNAAPLGVWNTAPAGGTPVGSWSVPTDAAPGSGASGPVGQWTVASPEAAADGAAAPVGAWKMPDPAVAGSGDGVVGNWTVAADAKGPNPVGQWAVPEGAAAGAEPGPVGNWKVPDAAEAKAQVGQWTVAPDPAAPGAAPDAKPIGAWSAPEGATASAGSPSKIGQWFTPDANAGGPPASTPTGVGLAPEAASGPAAGNAVAGALDRIQGPLAGGLDLQDVIRGNPNISGIRVIEAVVKPGQPTRLQSVLDIGRSILEQRFGSR